MSAGAVEVVEGRVFYHPIFFSESAVFAPIVFGGEQLQQIYQHRIDGGRIQLHRPPPMPLCRRPVAVQQIQNALPMKKLRPPFQRKAIFQLQQQRQRVADSPTAMSPASPRSFAPSRPNKPSGVRTAAVRMCLLLQSQRAPMLHNCQRPGGVKPSAPRQSRLPFAPARQQRLRRRQAAVKLQKWRRNRLPRLRLRRRQLLNHSPIQTRPRQH